VMLLMQWDRHTKHGQGFLKIGKTGQTYTGDFHHNRRTGYGVFVENDKFTTYGEHAAKRFSCVCHVLGRVLLPPGGQSLVVRACVYGVQRATFFRRSVMGTAASACLTAPFTWATGSVMNVAALAAWTTARIMHPRLCFTRAR
jgi:hypothetical protein